MIEPNNCYNMDCLVGMEEMQKQGIIADWCITDPPYGIGADKQAFNRNGEIDGKAKNRIYKKDMWDTSKIGGSTLAL